MRPRRPCSRTKRLSVARQPSAAHSATIPVVDCRGLERPSHRLSDPHGPRVVRTIVPGSELDSRGPLLPYEVGRPRATPKSPRQLASPPAQPAPGAFRPEASSRTAEGPLKENGRSLFALPNSQGPLHGCCQLVTLPSRSTNPRGRVGITRAPSPLPTGRGNRACCCGARCPGPALAPRAPVPA